MNPRAAEQLARLGEPAFARLFDRARRHLERSGGALEGAVHLSAPSDTERQALSGLLGRPLLGRQLRVTLDDLDAALRRGPLAEGLADVLVRLGGPLRDRPAERDARASRLDAALTQARAASDAPWLSVWLESLRADGSLARLDTEGLLPLVVTAARILASLPAGDLPLPVLASRATGDTKALGPGRLSTLVLRGLALRAEAPLPSTAAQRRDLWARFGVFMDDLSAQVLVLNLRPTDASPLSRWLRDAADHGEPFRLTLHQLVRFPLQFAPADVFACENPAILRAAAERLGPACRPLVCTEGVPSTAFGRLADLLAASGARLHYHGDFDWPGLRIAAAILSRPNASPWRLSAADYRAAVTALGVPGTEPLTGPADPSPWDPALAEAMQSLARTVYEESLTDALLTDLAGPKDQSRVADTMREDAEPSRR